MIGDLLPLAIAAAVYPTLLAIVVLILTRPHPARLLAAFLAGAIVMATTVAVVAVVALEETGAVKPSGSTKSVSPAIDLVAGVLAIVVGIAIWRGLDRPVRQRRQARAQRKHKDEGKEKRPPLPRRVLERDSILLAFVLGIVLNVPSAWYLIALKDIAAAGKPTPTDIVIVAVFQLVMFAMLWVPLVLYLVAPDRSAAMVEGGMAWVRAHARTISIVVALVVGTFLLVRGLADLL